MPQVFNESPVHHLGYLGMDKKELIDRIREINATAKTEFLAEFSEKDLAAYLEHLMELEAEELVICH